MGIIRDGVEGKDGILRSEVTVKLAPAVEAAVVALLDALARLLLRFVK